MQPGEYGNQYAGHQAPPSRPSATASPTTGSKSTSNGESPSETAQRKSSQTSTHGLSARSCITCRRRKVKCDKQIPCSNCTKAHSQCTFPAPGRAPRKPRQGGKIGNEREVELLKRLRRLEGVVEELSGQVEIEAVRQHSPSDSSSPQSADPPNGTTKPYNVRVVGMDEGTRREWMVKNFRIGCGPPKSHFGVESATREVGKLVLEEGKSRYVASPFWAEITDEVEEIKEILEDNDYDSDSDTPVHPNDIVTTPDHQSFVMGYSSSDVNLKNLHPLPSQVAFYWQTFLENVHPLTKLMHTPTMNKTIKQVQSNLSSLSPSTEALMFSIYFATITSMSAEEVQMNLGQDKGELQKKYRFGVEQALAKAGFLNTSEIVTVQALVLFLVCVRRHDDTRFVWSLTGLALRIGQSLGLHRDGTKLGLSPFDVEMRRRLWWQICILDVRASEDHGSDPSIMDFTSDTEFPLSVNDDDLSPEMTEFPEVRPGVSEMTFCLIRYEICKLSRTLTYTPTGTCSRKGLTLEEKEVLVQGTADRLEEKYLKHCEDAGPLYWVAATVARLIVAKMTLIIYHPLTQPGKPSTLSMDVRDRLFMSSIQILEYAKALEMEATTKHWGWLFHTYIQWHAIAYILGELAERDNSVTVDRAWQTMDAIFSSTQGGPVMTSKHGMLWQPLRKLMARARRRREQNKYMERSSVLGINNKYHQPPPQPYSVPADLKIGGFTGVIPNSTTLNSATTTDLQNGVQNPNTGTHPFLNQIINTSAVEPQMSGMGILTPESMQLPLPQQQQTGGWLMDDSQFLDMDMADLSTNGGVDEVNWQGWDDLVRDFQLETDNQFRDGENTLARGPTIGGMGNLW